MGDQLERNFLVERLSIDAPLLILLIDPKFEAAVERQGGVGKGTGGGIERSELDLAGRVGGLRADGDQRRRQDR